MYTSFFAVIKQFITYPTGGYMELSEQVAILGGDDQTAVVRVLQDLEGAPVTAEEAKQLGAVVNRIRKRGEWKEASLLATTLLHRWKALLVAKPTEESTNGSPSSTEVASTKIPMSKTTQSRATTRDSVRAKCVEMLAAVLGNTAVAEAVEEALFADFGAASPAYKVRCRSKYLNLKSNEDLRIQVAAGIISPDRFAAMSAEEMASAELRRADRDAAAKALRDTQAATDQEAETDQFRCGRCGKRRCKYYQLQTRSADEPMTTFVTCVACGNRWKFS